MKFVFLFNIVLISCLGIDCRLDLSVCPYEHYFVDNNCVPCTKCPEDQGLYTIEPCSLLRDSVCRQLGDYLVKNDDGFLVNNDVPETTSSVPTTEFSIDDEGTLAASNPSNKKRVVIIPMPWYINACLIVAVIISCICVLIIAYQVYYHYKAKSLTDGSNGSSRPRLFSRGRLSTTDYMKSLAGLDRQLAMDKILEQRREMYNQNRQDGNIYVDDVFVDISQRAASP